jgi:hypothetical protein
LVDDGGEGAAVDELHGVVVDAAIAADAVDRHDVAVLQVRRLGLVLEALQLPGVQGRGERQHLQGHAPLQRELHRLVNHPHAAPADLAENAVIAQLTRERLGCWESSRLTP